MPYISYPLDTDPVDILNDMITAIQAAFPGWLPNQGNLDTWLLQVNATQAADLRDLASNVPDMIFRYFGQSMMGIPPIDATYATVTATWVMVDNAGYTIPAGTTIGITNAAGDLVAFDTLTDIIVASGSTTATGVTSQAIIPGAAGSGLGANGVVATLIDPLTFVTSVTLTSTSTGGIDAETDAVYMNRLVRKLQNLSQRPILPADFASMALDADPSVYRAVAIDTYIPAPTNTYNNPRAVTVAAVDANGNNVSSTAKSNIDSYLQANREVNFLVYEMDPIRTTIDVTTTVKCLANYTTASVQANVIAAIQAYLNPATWGQDPRYTDAGGAQTWVDVAVVRYLEIAAAINGASGVDYITTTAGNYDLTTRIAAGTMARTDITMSGPASLPVAGTITVTAT